MVHCGIITPASAAYDSSHFPLVKAKCHYSVIDVNVEAIVEQTYISRRDEVEDISYIFPLPADAAVCKFSAIVEGRRISGVVKTKSEAKAEFDAAVSEGKTAALLEERRSEVFQISLGNIQPGGTVKIEISFVSLISHNGLLDSLSITLPLSVAPYYGSPVSGSHTVVAPAIDVTLSFCMASGIASISSSTHPISVTLGALEENNVGDVNSHLAHVRIATLGLLDRDVSIVVKASDLDSPRCVLERLQHEQETSDCFALTLVPRFAVEPLDVQEYIFLVDRSGSMGGQRIAKVRDALQIMLRSLPSRGTSFNIVSFGSRFDALWSGPREYTAESVDEASALVDGMKADYGGTEIQKALEFAFAMRAQDKPTVVLVLTDGEAWDVPGVITSVSTVVNAADGFLRVFTLGVGEQVSKAMCDGIARAGRGVASYVGSDENPDAKLVTLLRATRTPAVQDVLVDWGAIDPEVNEDFVVVEAHPEEETQAAPITLFSVAESATAPESTVKIGPEPLVLPPVPRIQELPVPPVLYPGFRCSLFAIVAQPSADIARPTAVTIRGVAILPGNKKQPVELHVEVTEPAATMPGFIHVLAARALMQLWEDKNSPEGRAQTARLGLRYGLASSQTSFVAIEDTANRVVSVAEVHAVVGVQGSGRGRGGKGLGMGGAFRHRRIAIDSPAVDTLPRRSMRRVDPSSAKKKSSSSDGAAPADTDVLVALARAQDFDGLVSSNGTVLATVLALDVFPEVPADLACPDRARTWATLLVLAYLEKTCADRKSAWISLADKAHDALHDIAGMGPDVLSVWVDRARQALDRPRATVGTQAE
ncbi:hypothetical protein EXIGLDRAFT_833087 [Exidia glandulosa HHB12029]|uniref:VIT-domain-containing protein n=1 Tax=Exidia glandulosa HHB12029 TaxID=1314781 RepID=A0A165KYG6_EXIGL|nr:hypothetical protein EXIGLDRAFT_833087 [Exidia glandulosa HHB12029]